MKKLIKLINAIAFMIVLTACESIQKETASDSFTISGDQSGQLPIQGSSACDPAKNVRIQVAVSGGAAGNTFTVNAFCGGMFLGSSKATDPGNGTSGTTTKTHGQVQGNGSCTPMNTASPTWSYICDFNL